jgi:hypothetical protein
MEFFCTEKALKAETLQAEIKKSIEQFALWEENTAQLKAIERNVARARIKAEVTKRMASKLGIPNDMTKKKRIRTKKQARSPEGSPPKKDDFPGEESRKNNEPAWGVAIDDSEAAAQLMREGFECELRAMYL